MKNFPIKDNTGREYWISRSVAVVARIYIYDYDYTNKYILAVKRGNGTPDPEYVGSWCLPCGYLDFNETIKEAASREILEETGLYIVPESLYLAKIEDTPNKDKRQNIVFIYDYVLNEPKEEVEKRLTTIFSEKDEVSEIKFINVNNVEVYTWAFNHLELI